MNEPISQVEVENRILALIDALEQETDLYDELSADEAQKSATYKSEWAKQYVIGSGAVAMREANADLQTEDICMDAKLAEARAKAKREKLNSIRAALDAYRTIAANVRRLV